MSFDTFLNASVLAQPPYASCRTRSYSPVSARPRTPFGLSIVGTIPITSFKVYLFSRAPNLTYLSQIRTDASREITVNLLKRFDI